MANTYTFDIKLEVLLRNALAKEYPRVGMDKLMAAAADGAKATIQSITQRQALVTPGVRPLTLLDLTPSIRQKIYHHLFFTNPTTKPFNPLTGIARKQPPPPQPPITRTNRLLRAEALPLFYALTHFILDVTATTKAQKEPRAGAAGAAVVAGDRGGESGAHSEVGRAVRWELGFVGQYEDRGCAGDGGVEGCQGGGARVGEGGERGVEEVGGALWA
ncbi:hypothetical protein Tdes44962_MAKER05172 [Teratosphaeria destructans]|uniref:Uncharacterized protein n=1 Tax=Teratosphaeria destructans TaxID=418781 RepID=A0A9W7VZE2_9PEZI|nr:hypothetical protein Tdes44962_MAKER05172 [Teratosphaeria destructans]